MTDQFILPEGYKAWCHQCAGWPWNKVTMVPEQKGIVEHQEMADIGLEVKPKMISIPGVGFKTIDECTKHTTDVHRTWKG